MAGDHEKLVQEYQQQNKTAFVVGYTGECGKAIVRALLTSRIFAKVVLIGRRTVTYEDELYKDVEQRVVDFDNLDAYADSFKNFDVGYCCLGTTRTQSGAAGYYRVDHDYVINCARIARSGGCSQYHLVSSIGANKDSFMLAARVKGESEEEVKSMGFDSVFIYRPALVLSKRDPPRAVDTAWKILFKPITVVFPTVLSIPATMLAQVVLKKTVTPATNKFEILENREMHRVAAN